MIKTYIISLNNSSHSSNANLINNLIKNKYDPELILGIDGNKLPSSEYYKIIQNYLNYSDQVLSPSEIGCALSHKKTIELAISSNQENCIIFEDDVIITNQGYIEINILLENLPANYDIIHLGGINTKTYYFKKIRGDKILSHPKLFRINNKYLENLHGTVGYLISKNGLLKIKKILESGIYLIDDYKYISKKTNLSIYYSNIVNHPIDINTSIIENGRRIRLERNNFKLKDRLHTRIIKEIKLTIKYKLRNCNFDIFKNIFTKNINISENI